MTLFAKRFPAGRWSFLGPGSEKKWSSTYIDRPQGEWDRVAELMMVKFGESGHPVFRATSPLSRGTLKSKGGGQSSIHFCADGDTIETVFRTIISVNQLSIYGAISDVCEEYGTCQTRAVRHVLARQSDPLFEPAKCMDDHQFREEENGSVGELSTICSHMSLKCLYLARIGRPDILWSVNKLACAVAKMDKSM